MSVKGYDSFLVTTNLGANRKVRRLTPGERWCAVHGVWAIAAESPTRGELWIAEGVRATEQDYAELAGVTLTVATSTVRKMRELGMLEDVDGTEAVHDWDQHQREPKPSDSSQARRDRKRKSRGKTQSVTRDGGNSHAPEVEEEVEGEVKDGANAPSMLRAAFEKWRERCNHPNAKLSPERRRAFIAREREGMTEDEAAQAIEGAARAPHVSSETGQRYDDFELIFRSRTKLDSFIERATSIPSARPGSESPSELIQALGIT